MWFYRFEQNNLGGEYLEDEVLTRNVIIEALSEIEANEKAKKLGISFDGCYVKNEGWRMRWGPAWSDDAQSKKEIFRDLDNELNWEFHQPRTKVFAGIFYADGRKQIILDPKHEGNQGLPPFEGID